MHYSPLVSSVQGIFQTRTLEWAASSFSREASFPVSYLSLWLGRWALYHWATRMPLLCYPTLPLDCSSWEQISLPDVAFIFLTSLQGIFLGLHPEQWALWWICWLFCQGCDLKWKETRWLNPLSRPWKGIQCPVLCHRNVALLLKSWDVT